MNVTAIDDAPWFTVDGDWLQCKVIDVYDGDTVTIIFPFSGSHYKDKCRLFGIDTPELRTKNTEEKVAGIAARDWLRERILNKVIWIEFKGKDKYGRFMGNLYEKKDGESINMILVQNGMACTYDGGKKKRWCKW